MEYGGAEQKLPSRKGPSVSSSQADYLSEESLHKNFHSLERSLEGWIDKFSSAICSSLLLYLINLFDPAWKPKKARPIWWPLAVSYRGISKLNKGERVKVTSALLCSELIYTATSRKLKQTIEDATAECPRPHLRALILPQIFMGVYGVKSLYKQALSLSQDSHRLLQLSSIAPPILQILQLVPSVPLGFKVDLNSKIAIEWRRYSYRGDPLTLATITWVEFQGGNLIPLDSLHPLLQTSQIAEYIQATRELGVLNLSFIYDKRFSVYPNEERSYMVFSIRTGVPVHNSPYLGVPYLDAPTDDWERLPSTIKEFETSWPVSERVLAGGSIS